MSQTRIPNPTLEEAPPYADEDSTRNVPDAEHQARLADRLNEAELQLVIQASALRLQSLALAQVSLEEEAEIA